MTLRARSEVPAHSLDTFADDIGPDEALWVGVKLSSKGIVTTRLIYNFPGITAFGRLNFMIRRAVDGGCLVLGDFNAPCVDWESHCFARM